MLRLLFRKRLTLFKPSRAEGQAEKSKAKLATTRCKSLACRVHWQRERERESRALAVLLKKQSIFYSSYSTLQYSYGQTVQFRQYSIVQSDSTVVVSLLCYNSLQPASHFPSQRVPSARAHSELPSVGEPPRPRRREVGSDLWKRESTVCAPDSTAAGGGTEAWRKEVPVSRRDSRKLVVVIRGASRWSRRGSLRWRRPPLPKPN